MGLWSAIRRQMRVLSGARGTGMDEVMALQRQRPMILLGGGMFELGQLASGRVAPALKTLAQVKTSALVGCPF